MEVISAAQCEVTGQLVKQSGCKVHDIAALAISSQRATFAPLDRQGISIGNFIGWQDARSIETIRMCEREDGSSPRYYEITGLTISPTSCGFKDPVDKRKRSRVI